MGTKWTGIQEMVDTTANMTRGFGKAGKHFQVELHEGRVVPTTGRDFLKLVFEKLCRTHTRPYHKTLVGRLE